MNATKALTFLFLSKVCGERHGKAGRRGWGWRTRTWRTAPDKKPVTLLYPQAPLSSARECSLLITCCQLSKRRTSDHSKTQHQKGGKTVDHSGDNSCMAYLMRLSVITQRNKNICLLTDSRFFVFRVRGPAIHLDFVPPYPTSRNPTVAKRYPPLRHPKPFAVVSMLLFFDHFSLRNQSPMRKA